MVEQDHLIITCYRIVCSRIFLVGLLLLTVHGFTLFYANLKTQATKTNEEHIHLGEVQKPRDFNLPSNEAYYGKLAEKSIGQDVKSQNEYDAETDNQGSKISLSAKDFKSVSENQQPESTSNAISSVSGNLAKDTAESAREVEIVKDLVTKASEPNKLLPNNEIKLILAWTVLHQRKPLWSIKPWSFRRCEYTNCAVSGNRTDIDKADLLLFRVRELKKITTAQAIRPFVQPLNFSDLPPYHLDGQMWIDVNQESPIYTHSDDEISSLNGKFNLLSNYLLDSDFSLSYIPKVEKKTALSSPVNYAAGKTKMAFWFVSHCDAASGRDEYVAELQKHGITVDIFGKCTGQSDGCSAGNHTCYAEARQRYRFYLAFENSICSEYITEKFWNTLTSASYNIPIALGAKLEDYKYFSPPNSYLHTRNFTGVAALAEYMKKVAADDQLFNSYHAWRESYEIKPRGNHESFHCYLCRAANEKKDGSPKYKDYSSYWSRKKFCEMVPEPLGPKS